MQNIFAMESVTDLAITDAMIAQAQDEWGKALVDIGRAYAEGEDYRQRARRHVRSLYAYGQGRVLFKPTRAAEDPFRLTEEGAVSYFVGGHDDFAEDKGFALQPWAEVHFENAGTLLHAGYAVAMGHYLFTPPDGERVSVEYTFGYVADEEGTLRIDLHHSSFPFDG